MIPLTEGQLAFTYCQVPVIYKIGVDNSCVVTLNDGSKTTLNDLSLDLETSTKLFERTDEVLQINVTIKPEILK